MHPFDVSMPPWTLDTAPEPLAPARYSSHTGPADPDATPKPHPSPAKPQRRSQRFAVYTPPVTDAGTIRRLAYLTDRRGQSCLTAARALFAPELLEETTNARQRDAQAPECAGLVQGLVRVLRRPRPHGRRRAAVGRHRRRQPLHVRPVMREIPIGSWRKSSACKANNACVEVAVVNEED